MVKLDDLFIDVCRFDIDDKVRYLPVKSWGNGRVIEITPNYVRVRWDERPNDIHKFDFSSLSELEILEKADGLQRIGFKVGYRVGDERLEEDKEVENMEERRSLLDRINRITPFMEVEQETSTEEKTKLSLVTLVQNAVPELEKDEALVTHVDMGEESIRIVVSRGKVERIQLPLPWKFGEKAREQE